jgi:hypothetical protein
MLLSALPSATPGAAGIYIDSKLRQLFRRDAVARNSETAWAVWTSLFKASSPFMLMRVKADGQDLAGVEIMTTLRTTKEWRQGDWIVKDAWSSVNDGVRRSYDPQYYLHLMQLQK